MKTNVFWLKNQTIFYILFIETNEWFIKSFFFFSFFYFSFLCTWFWMTFCDFNTFMFKYIVVQVWLSLGDTSAVGKLWESLVLWNSCILVLPGGLLLIHDLESLFFHFMHKTWSWQVKTYGQRASFSCLNISAFVFSEKSIGTENGRSQLLKFSSLHLVEKRY